MERQKQQNNRDGQNEEQQVDEDDHHEPIVTRIAGAQSSKSVKKPTSSKEAISTKEPMSLTTSNSLTTDENEQHHPIVTRIARLTTTTSMKKHTSSTTTAVTKEIPSTTNKTTYMQNDEQHYDHHSQSESTRSFKKQLSTKTSKYSNVNVSKKYKKSNDGSPITGNDLDLDLSQISYNPFVTSTTNIIDQEFNLNDDKDHAGRNDVKDQGTIKISEREK
jgi:hypothetical protein